MMLVLVCTQLLFSFTQQYDTMCCHLSVLPLGRMGLIGVYLQSRDGARVRGEDGGAQVASQQGV